MPASPSDIVALWRQRGAMAYAGEGVTQLQHAWQCGRWAAAAGATPDLQLAAWLHDLGHLMTDLAGSPTLDGIDDRHETLAQPLLQHLFGDAVAQPVALHVQAKRYLVGSRPDYRATLSADSIRSLALQGGAMDDAGCARFIAQPFARDATRLRIWDDRAKDGSLMPDDDSAALSELTALMDDVMRSRIVSARASVWDGPPSA